MEMMKRPANVTFTDLSETLPADFLAPIDRIAHQQEASKLTELQQSWWENGTVYLPKFLPEDLMMAYEATWRRHNDKRENGGSIRWGGWPVDTPYLHIKELRDLSLYAPLMSVLKELTGETMGLHLNLTGWVTTGRDFHQDSYLNPEFVGSHYAAVWMALEDINEDSGPFEFIPRSNRWPVIRQHKLFKHLSPEQQADPSWPAFTQEWVADVCLEEARARQCEVVTYLPQRGDVLIWHSQLVHRGSPAKKPGTQRKALISHYSTLSSRSDMPRRAQHANGEWFFVFDHPLK